jgi:Tfp pilus assembly protein PilN
MIRINLATRKQSVALVGDGTQVTSATKSLFKFDTRLDGVKDLPIRKFAIFFVAAFALHYFVTDFEEQSLVSYDAEISKLNIEQSKLQADFGKTKEYAPLKKQLDLDETMIRTKISTVQRLIADRQTPPKLFAALSSATPDDVWLSEMQIKGDEVDFVGNAQDFSDIPDFMKSISESAYFSDISLQESSSAKDTNGQALAHFKLSAKRRRAN